MAIQPVNKRSFLSLIRNSDLIIIKKGPDLRFNLDPFLNFKSMAFGPFLSVFYFMLRDIFIF